MVDRSVSVGRLASVRHLIPVGIGQSMAVDISRPVSFGLGRSVSTGRDRSVDIGRYWLVGWWVSVAQPVSVGVGRSVGIHQSVLVGRYRSVDSGRYGSVGIGRSVSVGIALSVSVGRNTSRRTPLTHPHSALLLAPSQDPSPTTDSEQGDTAPSTSSSPPPTPLEAAPLEAAAPGE